jgi:FKBP-type peptidyl-prolyl cis-trans isomerase FklB
MDVKRVATLAVALVVAAGAAGAQTPGQELKTEKDMRSYALGMDLGNQFRTLSVEIDPVVFAKALSAALAGGKTMMTVDEAKAVIARMQAELQARQAKAAPAADAKQAGDNKKAGDAYLADNKAKAGVVTLPSGLQYKVIVAGSGRKPLVGETVVCHYRGTLVDGTEVDNSYKRNVPATFPMTGVIPGWTEALQLMAVGAKWQVVIPPELAYGLRGKPPVIPPNATLVFEMELLAIK